jgi:acyl-CoA reductase-like NAD-dependent aldehyde dehydrogenase
VLTVGAVCGLDEAFAAVNDSAFGLQAGVFTHDIAVAFRAHRELDVGGVIIGEVPIYRAEQMPYGGTKGSGIGRGLNGGGTSADLVVRPAVASR